MAMWSLDIDNIAHPHLSFETSDSDQSPNAHLPISTMHSGSSAAESDQLCQRHPEFFFADDNVIFQVGNWILF
jgi:hypothetical protein